MKKNNDRIKHALHNAEVCEYVYLRAEFADWAITTAFYSALHFLSHRIFPFKVPSIGGKTTNIENIDQYFNYVSRKGKSKHELLCMLAEEHCSTIAEDYSWLMDMSMTARYHHYHQDREIAAKAIYLMKKIKTCCVEIDELKLLNNK